MYFGDGVENDLDDWSSFLEVPDFMTTFANSQARARTHCAMQQCIGGVLGGRLRRATGSSIDAVVVAAANAVPVNAMAGHWHVSQVPDLDCRYHRQIL